VLEGEAVHDGAEHAHVVGAGPVHAALLEFGAAEEVAAADDDGDLRAVADDGRDLTGDLVHHVGVDAQAAATGEGLSGQLQQNPAAPLAVAALLGLGGQGDPASFTWCTYKEGHCRWGRFSLPMRGNGLLVRSAAVRHVPRCGGCTDDCCRPTLS